MAGVGGSGGGGGGGGGDAEMGGWTGLLHSSTKLLEQAAPTPHFPPLQVSARLRSPFPPAPLFSLALSRRRRRRLHLFPSAADGFVSASRRGTWTSSRRSPPSSRPRPSVLRLRPSRSRPPGTKSPEPTCIAWERFCALSILPELQVPLIFFVGT